LAVKYFLDPSTELTRRLTDMVQAAGISKWAYDKRVGCRATWPVDLVRDEPGGQCVGYVMPRIENCKTLYSVAEPDAATGTHAGFKWATLLNACFNLATTVAGFHAPSVGVVIGDLSPHNILVSPAGLAIFVDTDSMGFRGRSGTVWPSHYVTEEFAAPERLNDRNLRASIASDEFSLALVITQTLLCGYSPFAAHGNGTLIDNLLLAAPPLFATSSPSPEQAARLALLPDQVQQLAGWALTSRNGSSRPTADQWANALEEADSRVRECDREPWHGYCAPLDRCPFCNPGAQPATGATQRTPSVSIGEILARPAFSHAPDLTPDDFGRPHSQAPRLPHEVNHRVLSLRLYR
jgi:DNA-binding helix-hairpin-helix protein with protein kinase domain